MEPVQKRQSPQIDLAAILPTYRELEGHYATYLELLGSAVESVEKVENLQAQMRALMRPDYADHIPESAQAKELEQLLERTNMIDPDSQIFSADDITPIRQLVAQDLGDHDPDPLFLKLSLLEKTILRNAVKIEDLRPTDPIAITALQPYILLTIEFSVFTTTASGEQYPGGGADPAIHILSAEITGSPAGCPNPSFPCLSALSRSRLSQ